MYDKRKVVLLRMDSTEYDLGRSCNSCPLPVIVFLLFCLFYFCIVNVKYDIPVTNVSFQEVTPPEALEDEGEEAVAIRDEAVQDNSSAGNASSWATTALPSGEPIAVDSDVICPMTSYYLTQDVECDTLVCSGSDIQENCGFVDQSLGPVRWVSDQHGFMVTYIGDKHIRQPAIMTTPWIETGQEACLSLGFKLHQSEIYFKVYKLIEVHGTIFWMDMAVPADVEPHVLVEPQITLTPGRYKIALQTGALPESVLPIRKLHMYDMLLERRPCLVRGMGLL